MRTIATLAYDADIKIQGVMQDLEDLGDLLRERIRRAEAEHASVQPWRDLLATIESFCVECERVGLNVLPDCRRIDEDMNAFYKILGGTPALRDVDVEDEETMQHLERQAMRAFIGARDLLGRLWVARKRRGEEYTFWQKLYDAVNPLANEWIGKQQRDIE